MTGSVKEALNSPSVRVIVYAIMIGIAWGELRASVAQKADRAEVAATAAVLAKSTAEGDAKQTEQIAGIAADIRVIRAILCGQAPKDSFCRAPR
jgi:hypothetical protein